MSESALYTTELITAYSQNVQNQPVITFVGRPLDSAKALCNLFAALRLIYRLSGLPTYQTWLIGGDQDDLKKIYSMIQKIPELSDMKSQGLLLCFGKVAYDALPEFYSRSTVLVVPSWFETFGRVAVEAMSCGCPVIAADTTGLKETILDGITGILYPAADISSLAAILADFVASPRRANALRSLCRQWTNEAFSIERQFAGYLRLYRGENRVSSPPFSAYDSPLERLYSVVRNDFIAFAESVLQQTVSFVRWASHPHHLAAHVQCGGDRYLAVQYQIIGESAPIPHFLTQTSWRSRSPAQRMAKVMRLLGSLHPSLQGIHQDQQSGMVLFSEDILIKLVEGGEETILLQGNGRDLLSVEAEHRFNAALMAFAASPNQQTLAAVDAAGSELDVLLEDGPGDVRMRHPKVEIYRMYHYLEMRELLVDSGFVSMARCLLDVLSYRNIPYPCNVSLQRYDGVGSHYTGHLPLLLVLDECAFAVGPLSWALCQVKRLEDGEKVRLVLGETHPGQGTDLALRLAWLAVLLIFRGISAVAEGQSQVPIQLNAPMEQLIQIIVAEDLNQ